MPSKRKAGFILRADISLEDFEKCPVEALRTLFSAVEFKVASGKYAGMILNREALPMGEFVYTPPVPK